MEVYGEGRVLACFGSCPATSYLKLVLDWLESLNSTVDQLLIVGLDVLVGQRLQLQQLKRRRINKTGLSRKIKQRRGRKKHKKKLPKENENLADDGTL